MPRPQAIIVTLLLSLWLTQASLARAESPTAVVIIDSGTTDLFVESLVRTTVENVLRTSHFTIVESAEVGGEAPTRLLACSGDHSCTLAALSGVVADHVFFLSLRTEDDANELSIKIVARDFEVSSGKVLARVMKRCASCQDAGALAVFAEGTLFDLLRPPEDEEPTTPVPVVAPVLVEAPVTHLARSEPIAQSVTRTNRSTISLDVLKYAGLAAGVSAIATGTVLVMLDGPRIEGGRRLPQERNTATAGFVTLGAGVAAVGISAWLWSIDRTAEAHTAVVPTALVPITGGAALSWGGAF